MIEFYLNGQLVKTEDPADTPLLWVVRDTFKLTGSKFGCGIAQCGACTMHVDGKALKTCVLPIAAVASKSITTIEGLGTPEKPHPLQKAWIDQGVPQCGYCQSGQIMKAAALLMENPKISHEQVEKGMASNICRCGSYPRIKKAILAVAAVGEGPAEKAS